MRRAAFGDLPGDARRRGSGAGPRWRRGPRSSMATTPDGHIGEMDDAVDSGLSVRLRDVVVVDGDPGVLVGDAPPMSRPRARRVAAPQPAASGETRRILTTRRVLAGAAAPAGRRDRREDGAAAVDPPDRAAHVRCAASERRKAATAATSSGVPMRPSGTSGRASRREEGDVERGVDGAGRDDVDADAVVAPRAAPASGPAPRGRPWRRRRQASARDPSALPTMLPMKTTDPLPARSAGQARRAASQAARQVDADDLGPVASGSSHGPVGGTPAAQTSP